MSKLTNKTEKYNYSVEVKRAVICKNDNIAVDIVLNGVTIYGGFLIYSQAKDNYFYSFPTYKGTDGKYYNYAWAPIPKDLVEDMVKQVDTMLKDE